MSLNSLGQFALPVSNVDVAEAFYRDVLGLPKLFRFDHLVFFDCAGVRLMLEGTSEPILSGNGICHYFKIADIEKEYLELQSKSVKFSEKPHLIVTMPDHELWMAFFSDPDGHMLALMEERIL
jgi:methylmalonyl-CoA/ethylmalonyl-CoA epimerase